MRPEPSLYMPDTNVFSVYAKGENKRLIDKIIAKKNELVLSVIALSSVVLGFAWDNWRMAGAGMIIVLLVNSRVNFRC